MASGKRAEPSLERGEARVASAGQVARWVGLRLDLTAPRTWCGPSWALLAGVSSSGNVPLNLRSVVIVALAWLVGELLLGSLLVLSTEIPSLRQEGMIEPPPLPTWSLPYFQPGSPGQRLVASLVQLVARVDLGWRMTRGMADRWLLLALVTVVLSAVLGGWEPFLVLLGLLVFAAAAVGRPLTSDSREALAAGHCILAWLVGCCAFADLDLLTVLLALGYGLVWYGWTRRPPQASVVAALQILIAGLLVIVQAPLSACSVLLLTVPLLVLLPEGPTSQRTYLQETQTYLMASIMIAAWGLAHV